MSPSLRALLAGVVDYAGLFPPAKLPLGEAVGRYARYRAGPDAWMLGRFVCPAARLPELDPLLGEHFRAGEPFAVSALGRGGDTAPEFLAGLRADLNDVSAFRHRHGARVAVEVLEVRLPPELVRPGATEALAGQILAGVGRVPDADTLQFFFEVPPGPGWGEGVQLLLRQLGEADLGRPAGFKLRTGGLEASAFPLAGPIAHALCACRDAGVPFKATAGLHHPFPRFDAAVQATMHGFVNVFAAGVLARTARLGEEEVRAVVEDAEPGHFAFAEDGLRWGGRHARPEEIAAARREAVLSFGSCSFEEPRDDLRALGWM
jgi:hypothetical protein